jgi:hypothetical protein
VKKNFISLRFSTNIFVSNYNQISAQTINTEKNNNELRVTKF